MKYIKFIYTGKQYLSANAMKDRRNLLSKRSFSRGSLGSRIFAGSLYCSVSGIPKAQPIVLKSWFSLFFKLMTATSGWELEIEKKASTSTPACKRTIWCDQMLTTSRSNLSADCIEYEMKEKNLGLGETENRRQSERH